MRLGIDVCRSSDQESAMPVLFRILVIIGACWGSYGVASAQDNRILGEWASATFEGLDSMGRPQCTFVEITERRLRLSVEPGTRRIEGEWVKWIRSMWMNTDNRSCRWTGQTPQFEPMSSAVLLYSLSGEFQPADEAVKVHGKFIRCEGNACSARMTEQATRPFETQFKMVGRRLVDTNATANAGDDVEFVRVSDQAEEVEEAMTELRGHLKAIDAGAIGQFYNTATSEALRKGMTREQFATTISAFQSRVGRPKSRQTVNTVYVIYAPMFASAPGKPGKYVFLTNGVETVTGAKGAEFLLLVKEGGGWKVIWINYGS